MAEDITTAVAAERERLTNERDDIEAKMGELQSKLAEVDLKLAVLNAYEKALAGKLPTKTMPRRQQGGKRGGRGEKQAQVC